MIICVFTVILYTTTDTIFRVCSMNLRLGRISGFVRERQNYLHLRITEMNIFGSDDM